MPLAPLLRQSPPRSIAAAASAGIIMRALAAMVGAPPLGPPAAATGAAKRRRLAPAPAAAAAALLAPLAAAAPAVPCCFALPPGRAALASAATMTSSRASYLSAAARAAAAKAEAEAEAAEAAAPAAASGETGGIAAANSANDDERAWPHVPVLLDEVLAAFAPPFRPRTYVDGTLGAGGHASAMLRAHAGGGGAAAGGGGLRLVVGIDVDPTAHALAGPRLERTAQAVAAAAAAAAAAGAEGAAAADGGSNEASARRAPGGPKPVTIRLLRGNHSDITRLLSEVEWPEDELGPHPEAQRGEEGGSGKTQKAGSGGGSKGKRSLLGGVDALLLDLGVSSMQIDDAGRGFSFVRDGPLDMRMAKEEEGEGQQQAGATQQPAGSTTTSTSSTNPTTTTTTTTTSLTAADIVNTWSEAALAELIRDYGEEKMWRRVAARIVRARERDGPLTTTAQLAAAIGRTALGQKKGGGGSKGGKSDIHPATRTFQALRIAVNDELGGLERAIPEAIAALAPGGRLAVISFHSLEDRAVKHAMLRAAGRATPADEAAMAEMGLGRGGEEAWRAAREAEAVGRVLTRRPVLPSEHEVARNPRARSAKLRVFERFGGGGGFGRVGEGGEGGEGDGGGGGGEEGGGGKKATHRSKKWRRAAADE